VASKVLASSVAVLDEADRQQRIIDWMLFANEQDTRLFGYNEEIEWVPGEPIHERPNPFFYDGRGNYVRPMVQTIHLDRFHNNDSVHFKPRCHDCKVSWKGEEPCFVCGEDRPLVEFSLASWDIFREDIVVYADHDVELARHTMQTMQRFSFRATPAFQNFARALDETRRSVETSFQRMFREFHAEMDRQIFWGDGFHVINSTNGEIQPYNPGIPRNEQPFIRGERPSLRVVDWVTADLEGSVRGHHRLQLPANWRDGMQSVNNIHRHGMHISGVEPVIIGLDRDRYFPTSEPDWSRRRRVRG
jgi:hypothetical protein